MLIALLSTSIILSVILLISFLWERRIRHRVQRRLFRESRKLERTNHIASAILKNTHAYILLIDKDLKVLKTNYYQLTSTRKGLEEKRVGDLLKCHNALSSENGCGSHTYCSSCTIRNTIQKAFKQRRHFNELAASLTIETSANKTIECETLISGSYFLLDGEENIVLTVHDVTRQKQAEKILTLAKEKAENADSSKATLLNEINNEVRIPLNTIKDCTELLAQANTNEERTKYKEIVNMHATLLSQVINDILDISKIESGTLEFVYSKTDINSLLFDIQQHFLLKTDPSISVQIEIHPALARCVIETDRNWVFQALSIFTFNAIKFAQEASVYIGYETRETELYFYVTDKGEEVPAEKLPEVAERFDKLQEKQEGRNLGLGLAISKTIVTQLGGEIGVNSVEGQGSTFWFTIPYRLCGNPQ
ncbi:MAG TPA: HAMP domain-containing histidine kinase [Bacteroides reticulotermitis]|nr:HAMP domain-containing histidine kinase [Bacteroides reticulotermitis]